MFRDVAFGVLAVLILATAVAADDPLPHKVYIPIMAKNDLLHVIDANDDLAGEFVDGQITRPPDAYDPAIPGDFSVQDSLGGVLIKSDYADAKRKDATLDQYVLWRVDNLSGGEPVGELTTAGIITTSEQFISVPSSETGKAYYYALQARDFSSNYSDYTAWHLGIALRDTGIADDFAGYGGADQVTNDDDLWWLQIATFEAS
ncbi:MAG: hypothetical protein KJ560_22130, partial [Gammaproteobacteria bacterium]|nr:hypothetical protein [Gammaproteobacteria bacterium]